MIQRNLEQHNLYCDHYERLHEQRGVELSTWVVKDSTNSSINVGCEGGIPVLTSRLTRLA
jgi:hypothetical protein